MAWFLAGLLGVGGVVLMLRWMASAEPRDILTFLRWLVLIVVLAAILLLALSGRLMWAFAFLPILVPWFLRLRWWLRTTKNAWRMMGGRPPPGSAGANQTSEVETPFLRMTLNHTSGEMDGRVLQGIYSGRLLSDLSLDNLIDLYGDCAGDEQSLRLLESYLDRVHGENWHETSRRRGPGASADGEAMTVEEARRILGVEPGSDAAAVKAAYHRLMAKVHPDHGGSSYLAAKINRAKEILLGD